MKVDRKKGHVTKGYSLSNVMKMKSTHYIWGNKHSNLTIEQAVYSFIKFNECYPHGRHSFRKEEFNNEQNRQKCHL